MTANPLFVPKEPTPEDIENEVYLQIERNTSLRKPLGPGIYDTVALVPYLYNILITKYKPRASDIAQGLPFLISKQNKSKVSILCHKEING